MQIQTFQNDDIGEIRGIIKDGEPWFLAGQVCRCLGIKDTSRAIQHVKDRFKIAEYKGATSSSILIDTARGKQKALLIPEPYLYELIFASRKQKAIKFRTWITTEVLPVLRKHGEYRTASKIIHRKYTDSIKDKIEPALSTNGKKFVYSNFQKLINKSLGLPSKNNKDEMSEDMLEKLACRENFVKALIEEGKDYYYIKDAIASLNDPSGELK